MFEKFQTLQVIEPEKHLLLVTLNRPEAANAFNTQMCSEILELFLMLNHGNHNYRCVVITGAGDKIFSAGGDLKERRTMTDEQWRHQHEIFERFIRELWDCQIAVIAAVNGAAIGGGCEVALAVDFAFAADHARFALTETSLGIMPGAGGTQNLPRAVGMRFAKEMIFSNCVVAAPEAQQRGIVTRVFPADDLLEETLNVARAICRNAPLSIQQAKKSIQTGMQMDYRSALSFEIEAYNQLIGTEDRTEGVNAFNEKRTPKFKGH